MLMENKQKNAECKFDCILLLHLIKNKSKTITCVLNLKKFKN